MMVLWQVWLYKTGTLIPKPVEYFVMPFYTFRKQGFTGYGKISFNKIPYDNFIRLASLTLEGEQFGGPGNQDYHKAKIGLDLYFRSNNAINPVNQKVFGYYIAASDLNQIESLYKGKDAFISAVRILTWERPDC